MRVVMKTELKMKVSFFPRSKKSKSEICPIMLRVSLNGSRISLGQTGFEVASDMMKKDRVLKNYPNSDYINDELQKLEQKIYILAEELYHKDQLDLYSLRDAFTSNEVYIPYTITVRRPSVKRFAPYVCATITYDDNSEEYPLLLDGDMIYKMASGVYNPNQLISSSFINNKAYIDVID